MDASNKRSLFFFLNLCENVIDSFRLLEFEFVYDFTTPTKIVKLFCFLSNLIEFFWLWDEIDFV